MRQATTAWIMALTGLALVTGCGKKEMDEEKAREVESFLEEVSEVTNLHLDRYMAVHSRFLEVRNEEPGTPLQAGKAPFGGTAADSENPNTHILFYDSTVDDRFPTKYKDLSYWRGVSALTAILDTPGGVKADLEQEVWDPFQKIQFEEFALALEEFQYVVIVRGKTEKAVVEAGKKTGYRPGFFSGAGFVFEVGSGKYLGQYPVKASSQAEVHHGSGTDAQKAVDDDLERQTRAAARRGLEKYR